MIIDVHSHVWEYPRHFGDGFRRQAIRARAGVEVDLTVRYEDYRKTCPPDTKTIVFGGKARLSDQWVEDKYVADYVGKHPDTLIGFLCLDPTQEGWEREMREGHETLGLRGIKLLPMYAGFRPDDARLDPMWKYATEKQLPVLLHTGTTFVAQAPLECTLPRHVDTVAIKYPDVKIIMAHLGHPYEGECVATFRKHPNVYADVSGLLSRPWQAYDALVNCYQAGVIDKLLFGSDFPYTNAEECIESLYSINQLAQGTNLPVVPREALRGIVERDAPHLLGLV